MWFLFRVMGCCFSGRPIYPCKVTTFFSVCKWLFVKSSGCLLNIVPFATYALVGICQLTLFNFVTPLSQPHPHPFHHPNRHLLNYVKAMALA